MQTIYVYTYSNPHMLTSTVEIDVLSQIIHVNKYPLGRLPLSTRALHTSNTFGNRRLALSLCGVTMTAFSRLVYTVFNAPSFWAHRRSTHHKSTENIPTPITTDNVCM